MQLPGFEKITAHCRVADVVALPSPSRADAWLSCHSEDGLQNGVGMRRVRPSRLERQPVHVIGVNSFTPQQPESGE